MALLKIRIYPDPVLTTRATDVEEFDDELETLVDDMAETMYHDGGIGLAAPQIGVSKRILVMDCSDPGDPEAEGAPGLLAFINPEILRSGGTITWEEGCPSFPGLTVEVDRFAEIRVRAWDAEGQPFEAELAGLPAVCFQHELDHLDGVVILDRVGPIRRARALVRWKKLRQEHLAREAESEGAATV